VGPDPTMLEDSGRIELQAWATSISPGAPHEVAQKLHFITENDNPALFSIAPAVNENGTLSFRPAPNAHGRALVSIQLHDDGGTAFNGSDTSVLKTFSITVLPVNDRPIANPGFITCVEDASAEIILTSLDPDGDSVAYRTVSQPEHGTLSGSGSHRFYFPNTNYFGPDSFSFTVSDGQLESEPATIRIQVQPVNDPPTLAISISPLFQFPDEAGYFVASLNGSNASVLLDASSTTDIDNDPLQFLWFAGENPSPFAAGPTVTTDFIVGAHDLKLTVSDSVDAVTQSFRIDVITLDNTVEGLITAVDLSALGRQQKRPLISTLKAATASLAHLDYRAALSQLRAFENKVNAQVLPIAPDLSEQWLAIVREIKLLAQEALTSQ
jgi:hypothetical protein